MDFGTDGDSAPEATWPHFERFLEEAARTAENGAPTKVSIRELLSYVEAKRRGSRVIEDIQTALDRYGLYADPSFATGWVDTQVTLRRTNDKEGSAGESRGRSEPSEETPGISLTVNSLRSASAGAVSIERNGTLESARALMLKHDYSQLAVMSGARRLAGAVSWESMARAAIRNPDFSLPQAIVPSTPVNPDEDLIALIPRIVEQGFVFVSYPDHTIGGIVTTADLSEQFGTLAKPFLLLGEIERRLRHILTMHFSREELSGLRDPSDGSRVVEAANDLTLGEIAHCLENPANWLRLSWPIDRSVFVDTLNEVREIRNEVTHFSPDPLTVEQDDVLENFARWLRVMSPGQ